MSPLYLVSSYLLLRAPTQMFFSLEIFPMSLPLMSGQCSDNTVPTYHVSSCLFDFAPISQETGNYKPLLLQLSNLEWLWVLLMVDHQLCSLGQAESVFSFVGGKEGSRFLSMREVLIDL